MPTTGGTRGLALPILVYALVWGPEIAAAGPGTGRLTLASDGPELRADLDAPALALVGFARPPRGAAERETLELARENLQIGDAMLRLPAEAACRLEQARVDADPAPGKDETDGRLGARYRFHCDHPESLDSAAVGVFSGFPFLARIHLSYRIGTIQGEALLTPINPVVQFIPLR